MSEDKRQIRKNLFNSLGDEKYADVLIRVQSAVSRNLNRELSAFTEKELTDVILTYLIENGTKCSLTDDPKILARHIFHDMAGYGFITRENIFEIPGFEELNINAWNNVHIKINGKSRRTDYSFIGPEQAIDIHKRMLRVKNVVIDDAMPRAIADMGSNIRICCTISPIVDKQVAVASSIRRVSLTTLDLKALISSGTATVDMVDFLLMCLRYGASIIVSGETGSGKTTTLGALLAVVARKVRMITIEEGSREWDFVVKDENGVPQNDVVHKLTKSNIEDQRYNFDQEYLIKDALREDPDLIALGEIRGREALEVMGAANTGHTVATTVHSNGAEDTPERVVTLAKKAFDLTDSTLYSMFTRAFPILVHQEKLADGKRRITQIFELSGYKNGELEYNPIFQYEVHDNIYENDEILRVDGSFEHLNSISKKMQQTLLKRGARREVLDKFYYKEGD